MMTSDRDMMRDLLREAAGPAPDPAPSRRAIRAALADGLARRRRHDKRVRVAGTLALSALLVAGLISPLGSDDFDIEVTSFTRNGHQIIDYSLGMGANKVKALVRESGPHITAQQASDLLMAKVTTEIVPILAVGWQIAEIRHFKLSHDYTLPDGTIWTNSNDAPGYPERNMARIRARLGSAPTDVMVDIIERSTGRAPDLTMPMVLGDLQWNMKGWRHRLPDGTEVIYYEGLRADGVRSRAD